MGLTTDEQKAVTDFRNNVVEPSMTKLVVLDFWAEWCGPCKQLGPVIEKVCAEYADRGVMLVKIDVDQNRFIAEQFRIQSIPTVYAMFQGQPVADMSAARSESQIRQLLDQLLAKLPIKGGGDADEGEDIAPLLAMGEDLLAQGQYAEAQQLFAELVQRVPGSAAYAGLVRALAAGGQVEEAKGLLDQLPEELASDPEIDRARAAVALAADRPAPGAVQMLADAVEAAPEDHEKRLQYASALFADGNRDEAAEQLLQIVRADNGWNDGAARQKLLQIFETIGLEDPWVSATRRKLSAALFG